ncbi:hypothetical protein DXG03_006763, partial [Asterophora parasitica]
MAIDLLAAHTPEYLYRYDLESFFYILVWAALHYDFPCKTRASRVHWKVESWTVPHAHIIKKILFMAPSFNEELIARIPAHLRDQVASWI